MADFAPPPLRRDQMVLFSEKLDHIIGARHTVRLLDEILDQIDWSSWERRYHLRRGQPPIHPRVLAGVILYGILCRIRSSRALEEALEIRNDFRWLAEGRSIDHTTLCKFRQSHQAELKDLFVQLGLVAQKLGHLKLTTLAFDGTRIRANNRKTGTRTATELKQKRAELQALYLELEEKLAARDAAEDEQFGDQNGHELEQELAAVTDRREQVNAALLELARLEEAEQTVPGRIPVTDPESRVMPNKEGGFAPNYTPLATVDAESGLMVAADVNAEIDESGHLVAAVQDVRESLGDDSAGAQVLADGMMATGENLTACAEQGIELYSPLSRSSDADNPAVREDPSQPVPADQIDQLPTKTTKHKDGRQTTQLNKEAFVYDEQNDCYWCPAGEKLKFVSKTKDRAQGRRYERFRYKSDPAQCAECPLAQLCLAQGGKRRQVTHTEHESARRAHAEKMQQPESQAIYARRRHPGERPFAVIKQHFGARRFLTRGLQNVRQEWLWLSGAFNLHRLISLICSGVDPPAWCASLQSS